MNVSVVMNSELEKMCKDLPWPSLRYCPHINMEGLREMTKNASSIALFPCHDLNPELLGYEAGISFHSLDREIPWWNRLLVPFSP